MSRIPRRSLILVVLAAILLTTLVAMPLQAGNDPVSSFQSSVLPTPTPPAPRPGVCSGFYYTVRAGDTLSSIALRFGVSVASLRSCNYIPNPNRIFAGQALLIPSNRVPPPQPPPPGGGSCGLYTVRYGDTLSAIARRFGTTVAALQSANGIANPNRIYAGQVLRVPCGGGTTPPPATGTWYRVVAGDTVNRIAARFGVSPWSIINLNGLHYPYTIYVGQYLRVR